MKLLKKIFSKGRNKLTKASKIFNQIKSGDIAIDCGANIGNITEVMAKNGAIVYAFEPNPYAFNELKKRFKDNNKVICIQKGVYDKKGILKLYLHEYSNDDEIKWSTGSSFLEYKSNVLNDKFVEVEVIDFDEFINSIEGRIKFVKMDVEGAEYQIINKLIVSGNINKIDYFFVETHENKIPELKSLADKVRKKIKNHKLKNIDLNWI